MARLFGAYVIVDWSAAEGKKTGESSVWIGVMKRDVRFRLSYEAHNPATRAEAVAQLKTILADLHKRGDRVFVGFDFNFGFPRGTAAKLGLTAGQDSWKAMWDFVIKNVVDKADNTNNRFAVAAKINRLTTDDAYPFWGCPKNAAQKWLSTLKPASYGEFPEFRLTEEATRKLGKHAQAKSVWQMHGAGVVGGQTLLGIPAVRALKDFAGERARIWPFETGFGALSEDALDGVDTVLAEVYPSLYPGLSEPGEVKDAAQVRLTATALAELDDKAALATLFAAPAGLSEDDMAIALGEEGWILGV
ncbi:MAG: cobalamin biosynthesis protein CbiG [Asticcacaulis sp.]